MNKRPRKYVLLSAAIIAAGLLIIQKKVQAIDNVYSPFGSGKTYKPGEYLGVVIKSTPTAIQYGQQVFTGRKLIVKNHKGQTAEMLIHHKNAPWTNNIKITL